MAVAAEGAVVAEAEAEVAEAAAAAEVVPRRTSPD